jgi:hypothetical protein
MWDKRVNHMIIVRIYLDYCLIIGKEESVTSFIDELKNHDVNSKFERNVNEYLSFCIEESKDETKLTTIQAHLLTHLTKNFGGEIKGKRKLLTMGTLRFKIQKSKINIDVLDAHYQRRYRSGIGILSYLTKYSCTDICKIVRGLSKCMDSATWGLTMIS